jgi:hypothetical protein
MGIINGSPADLRPEAPVTYAEFATMLVRGLGFEQDGAYSFRTAISRWPRREDLEDVVAPALEPADRGVVAALAYNAIFNARYSG